MAFFVLCDADMIFTDSRPRLLTAPSATRWSQLDYSKPEVQRAAARFGVEPFGRDDILCAVPYVLPREVCAELADAWLEAIDLLPTFWIAQMYAFGLAVLKLGLRLRLSDGVSFDFQERCDRPPRRSIIHYAYGSKLWRKRDYFSSVAARRVWSPPAGAVPGSVTAEILTQLAQARDYYLALKASNRP